MSPVKTTVSVVIIGRNEGVRLVRCFDSIPGGHEVIYVDSSSTDSSVATAAARGALVIALNTDHPTAAKARNAGWKAAQGEWVLFLDGDTLLHPEFVPVATQAASKSNAAVWGHRREIFPNVNVFHRVLDLDWVYAPGLTDFCGGDALMRRSALEAVGGFDENLIAGEEPELCARLREHGYTILHIDAPMTSHDMAITRWSQYWRRATRAGYAYAQMSRKTRNNAVRLWSAEARGNATRALALLTLAALALPVPQFGLPILAALALRSAWRARWKTHDRRSLLCYGVHSHLQQIPIFAGQISFWFDVAQNRRRGLIEYK